MEVLSRNYRDDWGRDQEKLVPMDGFKCIFEPIERVDTYQFATWEELTDTLLSKGIVLTPNGYKRETGQLLILLKNNQILGYAARSAYGNRVIIDSNHALVE